MASAWLDVLRSWFRKWSRASETALAIGFLLAAVAASDPVIAGLLLLAGAFFATLSIWSRPTGANRKKALLTVMALLAFAGGGGIVWWRLLEAPKNSRGSLLAPMGPGDATGTMDTFLIDGQEAVRTLVVLRSLHCDIVRVEAFSDEAGIHAERAWIRKYYPESTIVSQGLTRPTPVVFDYIVIRQASGTEKIVAFDISAAFLAREQPPDYTRFLATHRREICGSL